LHDSKVILYISGGLLYYLATTLPVWMENTNALSSLLCCTRSKKEQQSSGVRIVAVRYIPPGPDGRRGYADRATDISSDCVVSVTIQVDAVALERFRAGQYVRLVAPEVSMVAHPFTMIVCHPRSSRRNQQRQQQQHTDGEDDDAMTTNEIDGSDGRGDYHCMQIMFRATGNFTKQLAERLVVGMDHDNAALPRLPVLRLDGFYGTTNRLRTALLQHDVILIVAGGIGITPYLSLLHQLHQNLVVSRRQAKLDELQEQELQHQQSLVLQQGTSVDISFGADYDSSSRHNRQFRSKRIVVHWMCRDAALIDYIKREYFYLLLDDSSTDSNSGRNDSIDNDFCMQLVIHQTGIPASTTRRIVTATTVLCDCDIIHNPRDDDDDQTRTREQHELVTAEQPIVMGVPFRPSKFAAATKTSYLGNAPLLLSFLLIGWIGLIILWFCYTNLVSSKHRHGLVPRSLGMLSLLIWSVTIAVVLNWLFTPAWEDRWRQKSNTQNDIDETHHDDVEESTPTLSLQAEMAKRYCYTALHHAEQQGGLNNNDTSSAAGLQQGTLHDTTFGDGTSVRLEERCGRPNVCEFLHVFDDHNSRANYPAVYLCGPNDLTQSLREAIKERGLCKIALYQESFEM
jgi:ferredoxin-NADP reductase